jgi:hypothetical protein
MIQSAPMSITGRCDPTHPTDRSWQPNDKYGESVGQEKGEYGFLIGESEIDIDLMNVRCLVRNGRRSVGTIDPQELSQSELFPQKSDPRRSTSHPRGRFSIDYLPIPTADPHLHDRPFCGGTVHRLFSSLPARLCADAHFHKWDLRTWAGSWSAPPLPPIGASQLPVIPSFRGRPDCVLIAQRSASLRVQLRSVSSPIVITTNRPSPSQRLTNQNPATVFARKCANSH